MEETLGYRHRVLNEKTNKTVEKKTPFAEIEASPENSDTDRLYKIDVASKYRNVPYILENLKSKDDLYVSRALKCTWLYRDSKHADLINPTYLEKELFPHMLPRSVNKMLLQIRIHLSDEKRAEMFYLHFVECKKEDALKWLPKCSAQFIEERIEKIKYRDIDTNMFKRLCEKSVKVFTFVLSKCEHRYNNNEYLMETMFILNTHPEEYFNCYEKLHSGSRRRLNRHATKIIMTKCPNRFTDKIDFYITCVHQGEAGKILGADATKQLIVKMSQMEQLKRWFTYDNVKVLVESLPLEGKFAFIKQIFIDKKVENESSYIPEVLYCNADNNRLRSAKCAMRTVKMGSVYKWYKMAPFQIAFAEIKKLIRTEASPEERVEMIKVLIYSAGKNLQHINTILQYIREKHINEPPKCKASIVGALLSSTDGHKYDDSTWKVLDEILHSLEFYTEEDNFHQLSTAVNTCIVRAIINKTPIPDAILQKLNNDFSTMKNIQKSLNDSEKEAVYNFLRSELGKKLTESKTDTQALNRTLDLLNDWGKNICEDEQLMNIIKDLLKCWSCDESYSRFYDKNKKWRRGLFEYSLQLVQTEDVYFNILKHKPSMILELGDVFDHVIKTNKVDLKRIMQRIRVYFPDTLAQGCLKVFKQKLDLCSTERVGYKAVTLGICVLMERDEFKKVLMGFLPENYKVQWSVEDGAVVNIRKYFAQQMYLVRPALSIETVLLFSKGDYLQFGQTSLLSICSKMSSEEYRLALPALLNEGVSLQKLGVRFAFEKLNSEELMVMSNELWNNTKNASIKGVLFTSTFDLLHKNKNEDKVNTLWALLRSFMLKLTQEEDRMIYAKMVKIDEVPESVRGEFCKMSYNLLKSLPPKMNCQDLAKGMIGDIGRNIDLMDDDFVRGILSNYCRDYFETKAFLKGRPSDRGSYNAMLDLLVAYTISCKTEESQKKRFEIMNSATMVILSLWNEVGKDDMKPKDIYMDIVKRLIREIKNAFESNKEYVNPQFIFKHLHKAMGQLPYEDNYTRITLVRLAIEYCSSYEVVKSEIPIKMETDDEESKDNNEISEILGKEFGKRCIKLLKEDVEKNFELITTPFIKSFKKLMDNMYYLESYFIAAMIEVSVEDPTDFLANVFAVSILSMVHIDHCEDKLKEKFVNICKRLTENENKKIKVLLHSVLSY